MTPFALTLLQLAGMESVVILLALNGEPPRDAEDARLMVFVVIVWPILWIAFLAASILALRPRWEGKWR